MQTVRTVAAVVLVFGVLVTGAGRGRAEEAMSPLPDEDPAPPMVQVAPPVYYAPAAYYPAQPPCVIASDLERRGRAKKAAGGALLGVGAGMTALGIALAAVGGSRGYYNGAGAAAAVTGYTSIFFGQLSMLAGIPVFAVGSAQVNKAYRAAGAVSFAPIVGNGGGAVAQLGGRF
jgi:hypothetical protein